jgi:DNA-binding transcriptional MerR regulator
MDYSSGDLIQRFNVTNETIRSWASEFRRHLSPGANPVEEGRHRRFTFDDLEVLTLVHEMREKKAHWEEIHASLDAGERAVPSTDLASLAPMESVREIERLHNIIEKLLGEIADLQLRLAAANTRADRAEGVRDSLTAQLEETRHELREAHKQIGRLEAADNN